MTVTNTAGPGHLVIHPQGVPQPTVSSINFVAGQTIANAVIVPAGTAGTGGPGGVTVVAGVSATDLLIDINGYFSAMPANGSPLVLIHDSPLATAIFENHSTTCLGFCGLVVAAHGGHAITGLAQHLSGPAHGVNGVTASSGVNAAGVRGVASAVSGAIQGVSGTSNSGDDGAAGVQGNAAGGSPVGALNLATAGVRGLSNGGFGVFGISAAAGNGAGVRGVLLSGGGAQLTNGYLGFAGGADPPGAAPWAVFGAGDIGATGTKHFLDPHPTDPTLVIAYVSLEGPEAGTYFRGRSRFQNGMARIAVPEHFRLVTDPDALTIQVTPIGGMATVGVVRLDLNEIVVQSSRNVEFSYFVQGVRKTFKNVVPVRPGREFMPESARARMPEAFSEEQRRVLVQNGTYREDGSANTETAARFGWDRLWAERELRPAPVEGP